MNFLVVGILVFIFVFVSVYGVKIEFFRSHNFRNLHYESNSTAKCNNVPDDKNGVIINSIQTDTCLMVYKNFNCVSYKSRKFDLDNSLGWDWYVRSFQVCNEDIGGNQLKIDITKYFDFSKSGVLERYRDVCTCVNLPQYVQNMTYWSISNYGNDFLAYYQPDCSENKWKAEHIPAGNDCDGSGCMNRYEKTDIVTNTVYKIQSIGPSPNSKYFEASCKSALQKDVLKLEQRHNQDSLSLGAKDEQLEKQMATFFTEMEAMRNTTAGLELKQENQYRSLEDSIEKLKDEFKNFAKNLSTK